LRVVNEDERIKKKQLVFPRGKTKEEEEEGGYLGLKHQGGLLGQR